MAKKITYSEPASYFNAAMKKADKAWDKKEAAARKKAAKPAGKKK